MIFDQAEYALRCEWGVHGIHQLAKISDVLIVVDVLSFSTAVDIAVSNGAVVFPYGSRDERVEEYAHARSAHLVEKVRTGSGFSLSPASLRRVPSGYRLVLPSPNGGALSLAAFRAVAGGETAIIRTDARKTDGGVGRGPGGPPHSFTACLRNAAAVARAARQLGSTFAVIPAGERWPDGSLRLAIEDWIGAGAVLAGLPGRPSPEAAMAIAAFEKLGRQCAPVLEGCSSGKELIDRGFGEDVMLAAELDASTTAPILLDGGFVQVSDQQASGH